MANSTDKEKFCCIYLDQSERQLSYNEREHIIPAGLGGKKTLPIGMVSDEANNAFSKLELKALRSTLLAHNRSVLGPGKRGSLSVKKVRDPKIQIMFAQMEEDSEYIDTLYAPQRLGFLFRNTVYIIPQILFPINDNWTMPMPRFITDNISTDCLFKLHELFYNLQLFINDKNRKYIIVNTDLEINDKFVLIGAYNNKWFIGTNLNNMQLSKFIEILEKYPLPDDVPALITSVCQYRYKKQIDLGESMPFVYVKTAFNTLAFFMGTKFVMDSQFDNVRDKIKNFAGTSDFLLNKSIPKWLANWVDSEVKPKEHFVIINAEYNYVEAYVSFYREKPGTILLSDNYKGEPFRKSFICNWECGEERYVDMQIIKIPS